MPSSYYINQITLAVVAVVAITIPLVIAMTCVCRYSQGKSLHPFSKRSSSSSSSARPQARTDVENTAIGSETIMLRKNTQAVRAGPATDRGLYVVANRHDHPTMPEQPVLRGRDGADAVSELDLALASTHDSKAMAGPSMPPTPLLRGQYKVDVPYLQLGPASTAR